MTDRFINFMSTHKKEVDAYHASEQNQMLDDIASAADSNEKSLLERVVTMNEESRLETQSALNIMKAFAMTLKHAMGAQNDVASCKLLRCGSHASCRVSASGLAACHCDDGYEGNGFVCNPPLQFIEHPLIRVARDTPAPKVADLHVSALRGGRIAVVYRDVLRGNQGRLLLGAVGPTRMEWQSPVPFGNLSQVYGPVLVELQDNPNSIAIAFRDKDRGGLGVLVGGTYDPQGGGVLFGTPLHFAPFQAQRMAMLPLPESRVVVFYAEHMFARNGKQVPGGAMYGGAVLARVQQAGDAAPQLIGKSRFVNGPVARISATMLSPTSFVLAYRHGEEAPGAGLKEASCMYGQLVDQELSFDLHHTLSLEPGQANIWARSVAHIRDGTFAYTYHSGDEGLTKQAILQVDPTVLHMRVLQEPTIIGQGFTPYVGAVSTSMVLPGQQTPEQLRQLDEQGPRIFTYFSGRGGQKPQMQLCKFATSGTPSSCQIHQWSRHELGSAAGAPTGDGRLVFVSTDVTGLPFYQVVGVMDPDL